MSGQHYNGYFIRKITNWETMVYRTYLWQLTGELMRSDLVAVCRSVDEAKKKIDDGTIEVAEVARIV